MILFTILVIHVASHNRRAEGSCSDAECSILQSFASLLAEGGVGEDASMFEGSQTKVGSLEAANHAEIDPGTSQNRPKIAPERPKAAQERSKVSQERPEVPKEHPKGAPAHPKVSQERPKVSPRSAKSAPRAPKSAPRASKRGPGGPTKKLWRVTFLKKLKTSKCVDGTTFFIHFGVPGSSQNAPRE